MADKLMVATKTFITTYDGRRTVVRKDKTRMRESHPIVQRSAGSFKPADDGVPEVEDVTARPGQKRGTPRRAKKAEDVTATPTADDGDTA